MCVTKKCNSVVKVGLLKICDYVSFATWTHFIRIVEKKCAHCFCYHPPKFILLSPQGKDALFMTSIPFHYSLQWIPFFSIKLYPGFRTEASFWYRISEI